MKNTENLASGGIERIELPQDESARKEFIKDLAPWSFFIDQYGVDENLSPEGFLSAAQKIVENLSAKNNIDKALKEQLVGALLSLKKPSYSAEVQLGRLIVLREGSLTKEKLATKLKENGHKVSSDELARVMEDIKISIA